MNVCSQAATRQNSVSTVERVVKGLQHCDDLFVLRLRWAQYYQTVLCTLATLLSPAPQCVSDCATVQLYYRCYLLHFLCFTMSLLSDQGIEKLIDEIKKWPALYNKTLKEYLDNNLKKRLWLEVCEVVIEDWNGKTGQQKVEAGKYIGLIIMYYNILL